MANRKSTAQSQRVHHEKYGLGVVTSADPTYTTIEFDEHGTKKFMTKIVQLDASDAPPPPRRRGSRARTKKKATAKTAKTAKKAVAKS